jgi:hypothetical protein
MTSQARTQQIQTALDVNHAHVRNKSHTLHRFTHVLHPVETPERAARVSPDRVHPTGDKQNNETGELELEDQYSMEPPRGLADKSKGGRGRRREGPRDRAARKAGKHAGKGRNSGAIPGRGGGGSRVAAAGGFRFRFRGPDPPNRGTIDSCVSLAVTSHRLL